MNRTLCRRSPLFCLGAGSLAVRLGLTGAHFQAPSPAAANEPRVLFNRDIRPILAEN